MRRATSIAPLVLASCLCVGQAAAQMQKYDGAARIGNLDRVTVVYPAAEGDLGQIYRDSGELRASYLFERYGVLTEVAADDAVTPEQRNGHLLLLGWNNALLGTPEAPLPFQKSPGGFIFAGARGLPGDDLLFIHTSPYNPEKYLTFWSRIQPELDRYLAFPFVGSDWVIYRDHLHVRQGMLVLDDAWPPVRDENAEHESRFATPPVGRRSAHYSIRYAGSVLSDERADAVLAAREEALAKAAALLGIPVPDDFTIELFVYLDVEHKQRETGVADPVHTLPHRLQLYMPRSIAERPVPHEEIHLLAARMFGSCSLTAMYEGLAFATESSDEELAAFAGLMVEHDAVPDLKVLLSDERLRKLSSSGQGFPAVGLLVHWIEQVAGREGVKEAYSLRRGNALAVLARLSGSTPDTVAQVFADWIRTLAAGSQDELEYRKALREAHNRGRVGDFAGRAEALKRALAIKADDPQVHYQLGLAYIEDSNFEAARTTLEALLARAAALEGSYVVIFSHYQLGRVHAFGGMTARARAAFERVLAMPDQHGAHDLARKELDSLPSD